MNYFEKHVGDWIKDTVSLDMTEDGAYNRLVDQCYQSEKPLPPDIKEVYRLARANKPAERKAVDYVLAKFFDKASDGYTQKRVQAEIARYSDKQAKARASADARWNKTKSHSEGNANASTEHPPDAHADSMRTHSEGNALQTPDTRHQTPDTRDKSVLSGAALTLLPPPPAYLGEKNEPDIPAKARVPLAPDWDLPTAWGEDAERLGFTPPEILHQSEKFRQYWVAGKGAGTRRGVKGWRQSWSNWLGNAERFRRSA